MSGQFDLKGMRELDAFLSAFPKTIQTGAVRSGLTAAAGIVRDEARFLAPEDSGKMAAAIRSGSPKVNEDGTISISVSLKGNDHAFLGLFHEYGVSPHFIRAGDATGTVRGKTKGLSARLLTRKANAEGVAQPVSRFKDGSYHQQEGVLLINGNVVSGAVLHPGHRAQPFMAPALDTKAKQAIQAFADQMQIYLHDKSRLTAPYVEVADAA